MTRAIALVLALSAGASPATPAQAPSRLTPEEAAAWQADLRFLAGELLRIHPNPFHRGSRTAFDSAVSGFDRRIPTLDRNQIIVGLMRVVALLHDGHTSLQPAFDPKVGFHLLPVTLYDFRDGLFVREADSAHADLIGARVVRIGRLAAQAALDSVAPIVAAENRQWVRALGPLLLGTPEVLAGLGITGDPGRVELVVEQGNRRRTVELRPIANAAPAHDHEGIASRRPGWVDLRDATSGADPLWLRRPEAAFWMEYLGDSRTLYLAYQAVQFASEGGTNEAFFRRAFAFADSHDVARVVIDVRRNGGGNSFLNRPLVKEIIRRPTLDHPDRLFVIIGRGTFSAAKNLLADLEYWTSATFVGEPNGNAPVQYGDAASVELPNSGITVSVSTARHQTPRPRDERPYFTPRIYAEMSSEDYRLKRDPALDAILRRGQSPSLGDRLVEALTAGDTVSATRTLTAYRSDPENRYAEADIEREVNATGYRLLNEGRGELAIQAFRLNTAAFPQSTNVYDSLGEAYERSGRRDAAIREYRRALAIDPTYRSSLEALRRLDARP